MSAIVFDNSVLVGWVLGDSGEQAQQLVLRLAGASGHVPALWPFEFANVLAVAERRGRVTPAAAAQAATLVAGLGLHVESTAPAHVVGHVRALALRTGLSAYDAAYLDLAMRLGAELATLNGALRAAARGVGVRLA